MWSCPPLSHLCLCFSPGELCEISFLRGKSPLGWCLFLLSACRSWEKSISLVPVVSLASTRAPVAPPTASSALSSPPRSFLPSEKATYRIFSYALVFLHPSTAERCRSPSPRPHDLGEGWAAAPCPTFYSQIPQPDCACSQPLSLTLYLQTSRQTGLAQQLGRISREIHRDKKLVPADARLRAPFIEQNEMVTF